MQSYQLMDKATSLLLDNPAAVLTSIDAKGQPRARWMHPVVLFPHQPDLYALTSAELAKVAQVKAYPRVEWMLQSRDFKEVLNLRGMVEVLNILDLHRQMLERIGSNLRNFWNIAGDEAELVVLRTRVLEGTWYRPLDGQREDVILEAG